LRPSLRIGSVVVAAQSPGWPDFDTTIRGEWWTNPAWIAVGIIGAAALIGFVLAVRRRRAEKAKD
jgi:hypothetical protein